MITGFEQRVISDGSPTTQAGWTTLVEEAAWWPVIAALGPRVRVRDEGVNAAGKALRSVEIGYPTVSDGIGRPTIVLVAQQHGGEAAGREALMQLCREWATTADPATIEYLRAFRIVCLPTCNPDGLPIPGVQPSVYHNGNDVNINRDHYALSQAESRLIQRVITAERPIVVVDSHENGTPGGVRAGFNTATAMSVYEPLRLHGTALVAELISMATSMGVTGYLFSGADGASAALRQVGGMRGAMAVLFETDMFATHPTHEPRSVRVATQVAAFRRVIDYAYRNRTALVSASAAARSRGRVAVAFPTGRVFDWENGVSVRPPPARYGLTTEQRTLAAAQFEVFALPDVAVPGGVEVSIEHEYPLIPLLFDARSSEEVVAATVVPRPARQPGYGLQQQTPDGLRRAPRVINSGNGWTLADARVRVGESWQ